MINIKNIEGFLNLKLNQLSSFKSEKIILYQYLYDEVTNKELKELFTIIHGGLNDLFSFMNYKNSRGIGGHFNANESRDLIGLIDNLRVIQATLYNGDYSFEIINEYESVLKICRSFLSGSGGSSIPEDFL